jgi:hypothetical protein
MRVSATKTAQRVERNSYITSKRIKGYGLNNDYPQKILEIVNSSGTGRVCMDIYVKFVEGGGFTDTTLAETILNSKGERSNSLLRKFAKDLKNFNGFACLVKYNGMGLPEEYFNIPFEHCRIEIVNKEYTGRIAVYHDWTGIEGQPFKFQDVKFINRFNPQTVITEMTEAGGPENYLGQILYYTVDGDFEYPLCPFDPIVTDMLTEESVSTVKHRNAKHNFLPAGMIIRKGIKARTIAGGVVDPNDPYNQQQVQSAEDIKAWQGDNQACKMIVINIDADEEKPEFVPFTTNNFDRQYELTEKTVQQNIAGMFKVPPVLRGVDIGNGFGSDLLTAAYTFMNNICSDERRLIGEVFKILLQFYSIKFVDFSIKPAEYVAQTTIL